MLAERRRARVGRDIEVVLAEVVLGEDRGMMGMVGETVGRMVGGTVGGMAGGTVGRMVSLATHQTPIIHGNTPACGGIIIYLGGLVGG